MNPDHTPIRALVVEDNEVNQKVVTRMLNRLGCEVEVANDGVEGVEMAPRGYAIIFMDLSMPRMDGYEASRQIRAMVNPTRQTPIVALTAHATPADRMACLSAGMDLWLPKPIAPEDLATAIGRFTSWKPGAPPISDEGVLDPVVVGQLLDLAGPDDPGFLRDLVADFQDSAESLVNAARLAFAVKDLAELRVNAGKLRRASGTLGAVRLAEACERVESADDATLLDRGPTWIQAMGQHALRAGVELLNCGNR